MRSHAIRWLAIPALVAGMALAISAPAFAQTAPPQPPAGQQAQIPSVGVAPFGTKSDDPNGGQWFVINTAPGSVGKAVARITNPADVPQTVKFYLSDLDFSDDNTPSIPNTASDVGTWGTPDNVKDVTIGPRSQVNVPFSVAVPANADPGDHVGVLIVEGAPQKVNDTTLPIVKRVATRLYVTIPGDAQASFQIKQVTQEKDSAFFTKEVTTKVVLHNTGRIRLRPTVKINGKEAKGPATLLSRASEPYVLTQKVPLWGGPVSSKVDVTTSVERAGKQEAGPTGQESASTFVIPYVLMLALVLLAGMFFLVRKLWRRRGGKYAAMQADLRRFERLLQQQRAAGVDTADTAGEAELAIKSAIKQAGRAGDKDTEVKLREKLTELREQEAAPSPPPSAPIPVPSFATVANSGGDVPPASPPLAPAQQYESAQEERRAEQSDGASERSVATVLRELAAAPPGAARFALIREARAHGLDVIEAHPEELAAIPEDLRVRLLRSPNGNVAHGDREPAPQGSEIA